MPSHPAVGVLLLLIFAGLLVAAAIEDVRRLRIPNVVSVAIALLYPAHALASPGQAEWLASLLIAGLSFGIGFCLFMMRVMGGGDVKLFAAATLWAGPDLFTVLLIVTALSGALIAVAMLAAGWLRPHEATTGQAASARARPPRSTAARHELPYGVAIAAGGLAVAVMHLIGA